jgi:hypothetical protein
MLYRTRNILSRGGGKRIPRGVITTLSWLTEEQRKKLIEVGAVTPVEYPPLSVIPGWHIRGGRLRNAGYPDVEAFLAASTEEVAEALGYREDTVDRWKSELKGWLEEEWPSSR